MLALKFNENISLSLAGQDIFQGFSQEMISTGWFPTLKCSKADIVIRYQIYSLCQGKLILPKIRVTLLAKLWWPNPLQGINGWILDITFWPVLLLTKVLGRSYLTIIQQLWLQQDGWLSHWRYLTFWPFRCWNDFLKYRYFLQFL